MNDLNNGYMDICQKFICKPCISQADSAKIRQIHAAALPRKERMSTNFGPTQSSIAIVATFPELSSLLLYYIFYLLLPEMCTVFNLEAN